MNQKIHFITYGDHKYAESLKRIEEEAFNFKCFDHVQTYTTEDIDSEFYKKFEYILKQPRIGGYGLWKFYFFLKHMEKMEYGDILAYADAGCTINVNGRKRFSQYVNMLNEKDNPPIIGFTLKTPESRWTVKEIYDAYEKPIDKSNQLIGGIIIFKKDDRVIKGLQKCLKLIENDQKLITDYYSESNRQKRKGFRDNRHCQSFLSFMRKEIGYIPLSDEPEKKHMNTPFWATRLK